MTDSYYNLNRERVLKYRFDNKDRINSLRKIQRQKPHIIEKEKQYNLDNKDKIAARAKQYRLDNIENLKQYEKKYKTHNRSFFGSLCHLYKAI